MPPASARPDAAAVAGRPPEETRVALDTVSFPCWTPSSAVDTRISDRQQSSAVHSVVTEVGEMHSSLASIVEELVQLYLTKSLRRYPRVLRRLPGCRDRPCPPTGDVLLEPASQAFLPSISSGIPGNISEACLAGPDMVWGEVDPCKSCACICVVPSPRRNAAGSQVWRCGRRTRTCLRLHAPRLTILA